MEAIVAAIECFEVVVGVSWAPVGTEYLSCFMPSDFANFLVIKFMLEPVSSRALHQIVCVL